MARYLMFIKGFFEKRKRVTRITTFMFYYVYIRMCSVKYTNEVKMLTATVHVVQKSTTFYRNFSYAISTLAKDNVIIITTTDSYYMDFTLNFYYSSLIKFNISNYIFGCTYKEACYEMEKRNIK